MAVTSGDVASEQASKRSSPAVDVGPSVRPASIRVDGLDGAGLRFSEAALASTTGPVFNADDLPEGEVLRPAQAIKGLYAAFNARDATCVASFLTDDCVYEDLLLGPATVCRGKIAFMNALRFHPAFVSSRLFKDLPFSDLFPDLTLEVDSIAEGVDTVGVEWHVQCGDTAFPLGRGLSQAQVCPDTGKIVRVVDIAEAPWRVIGLILLPFISAIQSLTRSDEQARAARMLAAAEAEAAAAAAANAAGSVGRTAMDASEGRAARKGNAREYELLLAAVLADGIVHPNERRMLADYAAEHAISEAQHEELLELAGWSSQDFREGVKQPTRL